MRRMSDLPASNPRFLLLLLAISTGLVALVVSPFVGSLFAAAVFAATLSPLHRKLAAKLGNRNRLSAAVVTAGLVLVALLPLSWLTIVVVQQAATATEAVSEVYEEGGTDGLIAELPEAMRPLARRGLDMLPEWPFSEDGEAEPDTPDEQRPQLQAPAIGRAIARAASLTQMILGGLAGIVIELAILVLAIYFLLAEGRNLVGWILDTAPLRREQTQQFLTELHEVTVAVFMSTVSSSVLQTLVAMIGYLVAGTPLFFVVLMVTFIAAFIPAIGGATVVVLVAILTLLSGATGWGIFLLAWGLVPVALIDNIMKPLLAQDRVRLPASVIFFAMLGGMLVFGAMGVVAGPLVVSFFLVVTRALRGDRTERDPLPDPT